MCGVLVFGAVCVSAFAGPQPSQSLIERADAYREQGRYLEALSLYKDMYMNAWTARLSPGLFKGMADIYYAYLGDADSALDLYEKIVTQFPDSRTAPAIHHHIAQIFFKKGDRAKSAAYYRTLFSRFPAYYREHAVADEIKRLESGGALLDDVLLSVERPLPLYVRVLIDQESERISVSSEAGLVVYGPESSFLKKVPPRETVVLRAAGDARVAVGGHPVAGRIRIKTSGDTLSVNGRTYGGFLWIYGRAGHLMAVNHIGLDRYLYGVLPREISPRWPEQVMMAQAVAARTYALYHMIKREADLYDVFSTTSSQVYGGRDAEHPAARRTVDATRGMIMTHNSRIVLALYHANSGGRTERSEDVWGSPLPYLQSVEDTFSRGKPGFSWEARLRDDTVCKKMTDFGIPLDSITDIRPVERAATGRIIKLEIVAPDGSFYLSGNSFRLIVGPGKVKSTNFEVTRRKDAFVFAGRGYGHGVGMSQWGAREMAKQGRTCREILQHYYRGVDITKVKAL